VEHTRVTAERFTATSGCDDWRVVLGAVEAEFTAGSFEAAGQLIAAIAAAADEADHHPDVGLRYPGRVHVTLTTHHAGGLTTRDVDLARRISALAAEAGATADAAAVQRVEIAIDTLDADRIRPFWAAVLGYRDDGGTLVDPRGVGPPVWFQQMDEPRTDRDRFHIDVSVPHDQADARVADAIEAGGRLVEDRFARAWWVLADADGNEACVCTWQDRDAPSPA
jgi:4a-hydroxytetrahydrobiopterin dehydratase